MKGQRESIADTLKTLVVELCKTLETTATIMERDDTTHEATDCALKLLEAIIEASTYLQNFMTNEGSSQVDTTSPVRDEVKARLQSLGDLLLDFGEVATLRTLEDDGEFCE